MKRSTPLTSSLEIQRDWEERTREKARRRERSREGREPPTRRRAALPKRGRNYVRNRRKQFGVDGKREWIISLPCLVCGRTPSDPHHEPLRSQGGTSKGLTPLCRRDHDARHFMGLRAFTEQTGIDLLAAARRLEEEWAA